MKYKIKCWECGNEITDSYLDACPRCNGSLTIEMDLSHLQGTKPPGPAVPTVGRMALFQVPSHHI